MREFVWHIIIGENCFHPISGSAGKIIIVMAIFWIYIILSIMLSFFSRHTNDVNKKKHYIFLMCFLYIVIAGCRSESVGADLSNYHNRFINAEYVLLYSKYASLFSALFIETNPIPVKTALNLMGFEVGELRMPLYEMAPANLEALKKAMIGVGLEIK